MTPEEKAEEMERVLECLMDRPGGYIDGDDGLLLADVFEALRQDYAAAIRALRHTDNVLRAASVREVLASARALAVPDVGEEAT
jgi:hypothetical protein